MTAAPTPAEPPASAGGPAAGPPSDGRAPKLEVRAFATADEAATLQVLQAAFGEWPRGVAGVTPVEFFRWKHLSGPAGRSTMLVVECAGEVVGFAAYMPWRFRAGGRELRAARAVDYAIHPQHQRSGASMAIRAALRLTPETAFIWSNPNAQSRVGGLRSGRRQVATLTRYLRPTRRLPGATLARRGAGDALGDGRGRGRGDGRGGGGDGDERARWASALDAQAPTAGDFLRDDARVSALASEGPPDVLSTLRDAAYLRWRYGHLADYRVAVARAGAGGDAAIFRVRRHGSLLVSHVCELFVERDDPRAKRRLLAQVARAAPADLISCHFRSHRQAAAHGFLPWRGHTALLAHNLHERVVPDPTLRGSWGLSLGDLELL